MKNVSVPVLAEQTKKLFKKEKKTMLKKPISIILSIIITLSCLSLTAFAADGNSVNVTISVYDGSIIMASTALQVEAGTAEKYGFDVAEKDHNGVAVEGVTVMDAVVAAHEALYGESFTSETAADYLVMSYGFLMKSFGISTSYSSFLVNGVVPNDGIINPLYGTPTGYACDTAVLSDGDNITYFFYQVKNSYDDMYAEFDAQSYETNVGSELTVNVSGYCPMYYGYSSAEVIAENTKGLGNVDIFVYENGELEKIGTTDSNGNATLTFDKAGEYTIAAARNAQSGEAPTVMTYSKVTIGDAVKEECCLLKILKTVWNFILNIVNTVIDWIK